MKAVPGFLAAAVALLVLAMPIRALAHDRWYHDHGHHWGWYKHHGRYGYGGYGYPEYSGYTYPGYWGHHEHEWWELHRYGGAGSGYGGYGGYSVNRPISAPFGGPGYFGSVPYNGLGSFGSAYAPNMGKMMQLQQTLNQRLNASQALYQAAVAQELSAGQRGRGPDAISGADA